MKFFYKSLFTLSFVLSSCLSVAAERLPNIIIIYTDDLGYGDLSRYNANCSYKISNIDKLAQEVSPSTICSSACYGLLSGQQIHL